MQHTQITLTGWIGGDVALRDVGQGRKVATFRVACRPAWFRDGAWMRGDTTWHTVKAWGRLAAHVAESLRNGDPVVVHGRLVADVWERGGQTQTTLEVVASAVGPDLTHGTARLVRAAAGAGPQQPTEAPTAVPAVASSASDPRAA